MSIALLFLHGVGDEPSATENWRAGLDVGLTRIGYSTTEQSTIIEPDYRLLLQSHKLPRVEAPKTTSAPRQEVHRRRGDYEIAQASLRRLLGIDAGKPFKHLPLDPGRGTDLIAHLGDLRQAKRYLEREDLRNAVLDLVLARLPMSPTELIVIGHSLGSLVAIDLLDCLPVHLTVRRVITAGSPAGQLAMHRNSDRLLRVFPYGQVHSWLNLVSAGDVVTAGRGIADKFPAAQDLMIYLGMGRHGAFHYLAHKQAARAIGEALFGSLATELARRPTAPEAATSDAEHVVVFALAYAHRVADLLLSTKHKSATRYSTALTMVQTEVIAKMTDLATANGSSLPTALADLADGRTVTAPTVWAGEPDQAVLLLIQGATTNLIEPYLIDVDADIQRKAVQLVASDLGFTASYGTAVADGLREAKEALAPNRLWKIAILGAAGLALLAAGPVGIGMAGAGGLAGGAAITSALAAFGPGGMVGGMVLAGAAASTGAAAATAAVALAQAPTAAVELQLLRRMAHSYARKQLKMPLLLDDWLFISTLRSQVAVEADLHSSISDDDSPVVKQLNEKTKLLSKAMEWMLEQGLGPEQVS